MSSLETVQTVQTVRHRAGRKHAFSYSKKRPAYMLGMSKARAAAALLRSNVTRSNPRAISATMFYNGVAISEVLRRAFLIADFRHRNSDSGILGGGGQSFRVTEDDVRLACSGMEDFASTCPKSIVYDAVAARRGDITKKARKALALAQKQAQESAVLVAVAVATAATATVTATSSMDSESDSATDDI